MQSQISYTIEHPCKNRIESRRDLPQGERQRNDEAIKKGSSLSIVPAGGKSSPKFYEYQLTQNKKKHY